jgi:hypothetical protein
MVFSAEQQTPRVYSRAIVSLWKGQVDDRRRYRRIRAATFVIRQMGHSQSMGSGVSCRPSYALLVFRSSPFYRTKFFIFLLFVFMFAVELLVLAVTFPTSSCNKPTSCLIVWCSAMTPSSARTYRRVWRGTSGFDEVVGEH